MDGSLSSMFYLNAAAVREQVLSLCAHDQLRFQEPCIHIRFVSLKAKGDNTFTGHNSITFIYRGHTEAL